MLYKSGKYNNVMSGPNYELKKYFTAVNAVIWEFKRDKWELKDKLFICIAQT